MSRIKRLLLFYIVIFFSLLSILTPDVYPRGKSIEMTEKGFVIKISIPQFKYRNVKKGNFFIRDFYEFTDESQPGEFKLPKFNLLLAIPPNSNPDIQLVDKQSHFDKNVIPAINPKTELDTNEVLVYEEMDFQKLKPSAAHNTFVVNGFFYLRNIYCVSITIYPYRFDQNTNDLELIDELELKINYDITVSNKIPANEIKQSEYDIVLKDLIFNYEMINQFIPSNPIYRPDTLYNWIDFNATYLKIGTAIDGIYRIFKSDLENYGINTSSINPKTFRFILKGNEIPIYVFGEDDNVFDDGDFIEFYGSKNYASGDYRIVNKLIESYSEYIDRYSDTTIYWLTWGIQNGARVDTSNQLITGIQDTINYYTNISHYEQNNFLDFFTRTLVEWQNPEWIYNESWIWGQQGVGTLSWPFSVSELVYNNTAKAFWRVQSYASDLPGEQNAHDLGLSINNNPTIYDSGFINKYEQKILLAEFSSDLLQPGQNNLMTHSFPVANSNLNSLQVDWYEIEYPRYLKLVNDSLKFKFNQTLNPSLKVIQLENAFSSNYILYKVSKYGRRVNDFIRINNQIYFADSLVTGAEFFIIEESKIRSPKFYYKKQFENLVSSNIQADYICISHPNINNAVNSYVNFIDENYSQNVKKINVLDIYDQFNYGFFLPESIREFLFQANQYWSAPKPSYIFFIGEANYDYHNYKQMNPYTNNLVPSFGYPVSDSWFAIWDSVSFIPQMFVGRLPAKNESEVTHYLNKHADYINEQFNVWNKSYFLLSGGSNAVQKQIGREIHEDIKSNIIQTVPTGGYVGLLYATENPRTNYGPFTEEYIDSVFDNGGIVVSYVGHSGTVIWDNGIDDVNDLKNKYDKYPLINDFGCSTGKFAEFDITSFAERFVNGIDGDAIAYQANSSLGFTSTSYTFPRLYFEKLLKDKNYNIGLAHLTAKSKLLNDYGFTATNKLFILTNTLIGDPIIRLQIPQKPNLVINTADVNIPSFLDDNLDSITIGINFRNLGLVDTLFFGIKIEDKQNNQPIFQKVIREILPLNDRLLNINVPVKNKSGEHTLTITLDDMDEIDELYENDNSITISFVVLTSSVRAIVADSLKLMDNGKNTFLNSVKQPPVDSVLIRLSSNPDFVDPSIYKFKFDSVITVNSFSNLIDGKRYWYETSFTISPNTVFERNSFVYSDSVSYNFAFADSNSAEGFIYENSGISHSKIQLNDRYVPLTISSAGYAPGGLAKIELNGIEYTENSSGCGHHIVIIDETTLQFEDYRWFNNWNDPNNYPAYYNYLSSIPEGKLVAISIGGECGGFNINDSLKILLHQFGSVYIDSVGWGTSWVLLGKLNAPQGSVPEAFSTSEVVEFDTTLFRKTLSGWFETTKIKNSSRWNSLSVSADSIQNFNQIIIKPIIHSPIPDTLNQIVWSNSQIDLSTLNSFDIDELSFNLSITANTDGSSPLINSVLVDYKLLPELATNYQVVKVPDDTVTIGENIILQFFVYNAGETKADSFYVVVEVINDDNSRQTILNQKVDSLNYDEWKNFNVIFNTSSGSGAKTFQITIDPQNQIRELFEDNNFYSIQFYVKPDTSKPTLNLTFDGNEILDGEYISPEPVIHIELNDQSLLPITDRNSVMIYLNDELIPSDTSIISYTFSETNPKVLVDFTPVLEDGEYSLRVLWRDYEGNIVDSSGVEKYFLVSNETKILNVYNYPNPTSGETHFTFKLTQIPEEINIKIFTIAGRLVREIKLSSSELKYDFNKIYWDGRDEDGDILGNGIYLYKVIMRAGDRSEEVTQKLAIVK